MSTAENGQRALWPRISEDLVLAAAGLGAGAGLMYLWDPKRGRIRRSRLTAATLRILHRDEHRFERRMRDLLHRAQGAAAEAAKALKPELPVSDTVLIERVRSRIGHVLSNPGAVQVNVDHGVITLEGRLTHSERRSVRSAVNTVHGVKKVRDHVRPRPVAGIGFLVGIAAGLASLSSAAGSVTSPAAAAVPR